MHKAIKKYKNQIPAPPRPSSFANFLKSTVLTNSEKSPPTAVKASKTTSPSSHHTPKPHTNIDISSAINNFSEKPSTSTNNNSYPTNSYNSSPLSNINTSQTFNSNIETPLTATNQNVYLSDSQNLSDILSRYCNSSSFLLFLHPPIRLSMDLLKQPQRPFLR